MKTMMGIIFANIYDKNMGELTYLRTMASVPYGGRYRQVDFPLSNMSNSGIRHIGIVTKEKYQSLMNHIGSGQEWDVDLEEGGLQYLNPFAMGHDNGGSDGRYRGKLDALKCAMSFLELSKEDYVVLVDGSVLCAMDYREVLKSHVESGADVTVVVKGGVCDGQREVDMAVQLDESGKVTDIACNYAAPEGAYVSTSVFIIGRELLMEKVQEAVARDRYHLERDLVMHGYHKDLKVNAYRFEGVALYNESELEYYNNSMALLDPEVRNGLFGCPDLAIYTKVRDEVPSSYGEHAEISDCVVADGCVLEGKAERSVLFRGVKIAEGACVQDCVIMQDTVVGPGAFLQYVILDKDVVVRPDAHFVGTKNHPIVVRRGGTV
jgi:glucose-1-phosphate adenylyltransferase